MDVPVLLLAVNDWVSPKFALVGPDISVGVKHGGSTVTVPITDSHHPLPPAALTHDFNVYVPSILNDMV